ncbi:MAG: MFS transporter [Candidatus Kariarchaeaceae archaeon]
MVSIKNFLGINQLPPQTENLIIRYTTVRLLHSLFNNLSSTFFILYIIDNVGFSKAGTITAILLFTQMIIDFPSGSLGDYIGHRWVLTIAYFSYSGGYLLLSLTTQFQILVVVAIILGFGNAQTSGALQSFLDNNFQRLSDNSDPERKNYGYLMIRVGSLESFFVIIGFMIGGIMSTIISRQIVFQMQSFIALVLISIVIPLLRSDTKSTSLATSQRNVDEEKNEAYLQIMKGSLTFLFSSKSVFLFILGITLFNLVWTIWGSLMLPPIYFGYTGSDSAASLLRSFLYTTGIIFSVKMAFHTTRINNEKLPIYILVLTMSLFTGLLVLLRYVPQSNQFNWVGILGFSFLMIITVNLLWPFVSTLNQRILLDLVPTKYRNSIYSIMPTMTNGLAVILLPFVGSVIQSGGMQNGVVILILISLIAFVMIHYSIDR